MMNKKISINNLKTRHFPWMLAVVLVIFLTAGVLFYWQNAVSLEALVVWVLGLVVIGLVFIFGERVAQRDGFVNGFRNGRNGVKKVEKKS